MNSARVRINTETRSFIPGKVFGNPPRCWVQQVSESRQTASNLSTEATKSAPRSPRQTCTIAAKSHQPNRLNYRNLKAPSLEKRTSDCILTRQTHCPEKKRSRG